MNQFTNTFNPAIGFVIDAVATYSDQRVGDDGYDGEVRLIELNGSGFIDPNAWGYVAIVASGDEIEVEEAAVQYIGFEGTSTVKAGRFFVDFGKQMQQHEEELRTLERPLVLREYLGEELSGTGVQFDHWLPVTESTPLRFSLGVFASLLGEGHGDEDEGLEPETAVPDQKDVDELSITARVTAMTDVGEQGLFQFGVSGRFIPEYSASFDTFETVGLSNAVYGVDATYGWTAQDSNKAFLLGGEALLFDGDLAVEVDDPMTPTALTVTDDDAFGYYVFTDYRWSQWDNAGVQFSAIDEPEDPTADGSELDFYYTRHLTDLRRIRFGMTVAESDFVSDSVRFYVQFTNFFGNHSHGLNW